MDDRIRKIQSSLEAQCARREYCSTDIYAKALKALDSDTEAASAILENLKKASFVDDLRYASAFAREKAGLGGWGPVKISFALKAKHIDAAIINQAIDNIDKDAADSRMEKLLKDKWKSLKDDPQGKLKLIRFALGRGYGYEEIKTAVNKISTYEQDQ